ncbi:MAG: MFS transporter [Synechococcaceae cyanobacterium SM2_3_60]|nr:MFS transporter [Synechococcaceae cyanobacterium SM2_3_60]
MASGSVRFLVGLGLAQTISWGSLFYSFPQIATAMSADLGWPRDQIYGAATVGLLLSALAAYPVGRLIDRGYGRLVMTAGSVVAGLCFVGWSQVQSMAWFYVWAGLVGSMQAATLYDPAFAVIVQQLGSHPARRGITTLTLFGGFASTVFVPLVQGLLVAGDWRSTLLVLGLLNGGVAAGLQATAIRARPTTTVPATPLPAGLIRWAVRQPVFWLLAIATTAHAATFAAFTFHLYPLLLERGLTTEQVVMVIACIGPAQVAGRLVLWLIAPKASVPVLGSALVGLFPVLFVGLAVGPSQFGMFALVALSFGAANGVMTIVKGLMVPAMLSPEAYGGLNGLLAAPATLARAAAPLAAALLWSRAGNYDPVLLALIDSSSLIALSFWLAAVQRTKPTIA